MPSEESTITEGATCKEALEAFRANVNRPDTIFSRDHWLVPKLDELRMLLSDPITADQATALLDVLHYRGWMRDLIGWLKAPPMPWAEFPAWREKQENDPDILWARYQQLEMVRVRRPPEPCPRCQSLSVVHVSYGLPTKETAEAARRGAIALGGCMVGIDSPSWCCRDCQHRWSKSREG